MFILRLAYNYWMVFWNLVNIYIHELASAIGIPAYKYRIFNNNKTIKRQKHFPKNTTV